MLHADFIDGRFTTPEAADAELVNYSPADLDDAPLRIPVCTRSVDGAVEAARRAFPAYRKLPRVERQRLLTTYRDALAAHAEELALAIVADVGKPVWEARTEVQAMVAKVDITVAEGAARYGEPRRVAGVDGEIRRRPLGVVAVLGPYNFPGHLPNGQIVPALLAGNTVVFKPSDKGVRTAVVLARCIEAAGFPRGAFNVVQGGAPAGERLASHPGIAALLFTGSLAVGQKLLAANAHRPGMLVALELGGKNASVVLDDADVERTVRALAFSAFATAGQRCTATSRLYVTRKLAPSICERLAAATRGLRVGHPHDPEVFMGPVISEERCTAVLAAQARARAAGFEALVPTGRATARTRGHYLLPAIHRAPPKLLALPGYTDTELFAPDLAVMVVDDLDEAIAAANDSAYGLVAAVYTASAAAFERCAEELDVGILHWNTSSAGASSRLPFGGVKGSGNHRPGALEMESSCGYPLAIQRGSTSAPLPDWPGLRFPSGG